MGGTAFTLNMLWAQVMPFVALQLKWEDEDEEDREAKDSIAIFLACSCGAWVLSYAVFIFCAIDSSFINTFFGTMTASQFAIASYRDSQTDSQRYWWVFQSCLSYTEPIHDEVKMWISDNINKWEAEKEEWFDINRISKEFLPKEYAERATDKGNKVRPT